MKNNKPYIYTEQDAEKMFFVSDTHFCHENIIKYCKHHIILNHYPMLAFSGAWRGVN